MNFPTKMFIQKKSKNSYVIYPSEMLFASLNQNVRWNSFIRYEIEKSKLNNFHDYFSTDCQNMKKLWVGMKASIGKIKDREEIIADTTKTFV